MKRRSFIAGIVAAIAAPAVPAAPSPFAGFTGLRTALYVGPSISSADVYTSDWGEHSHSVNDPGHSHTISGHHGQGSFGPGHSHTVWNGTAPAMWQPSGQGWRLHP